MQNQLITRWELTPESKFIEFSKELIEHLILDLNAIKKGNNIYWICEHDRANPFKTDHLFKSIIKFCDFKKYSWEEIKLMIDEYISEKCFCEHEIADRLNKKIYRIPDKVAICHDQSYLYKN